MKAQKKTSKYNAFETEKKNLIWVGAMCLAWQQLQKNIIEEPIKLMTQDKIALKIIKNFNQSKFKKKDINSDCIYVKTGFGQQNLKIINKQVKAKFKDKSIPDIKIRMFATDFISFAYLFKRLQFSQIFQRNNTRSFQFNNKLFVDSFYAWTKDQKRNILYYSYQNQDNFCISLKTTNQNDFIFIIKGKEDITIDSAINQAIYYQKKGGARHLQQVDSFQMPVIDLNCSRDIEQIMNLYFGNKEWKTYKLIKVYEALKLKIDQKGVKVENMAFMYGGKGCKKKNQNKPKNFILNKDFWIVMKQKEKHPYLCIKIKNPNDIQLMK